MTGRKATEVRVSLADRLVCKVAATRSGPKTFFDRLTAEQQAELLEVREKFRSGEYGASATAVSTALCSEPGYELPGIPTVRIWLTSRD